MAKGTSIYTPYTVDVHDFRAFGDAIRQASPVLRREIRLELRKAGEVVAEAARRIIEPTSKRVADSIRTRTVGSVVYVEAGGNDLPIALLFEVGNSDQRSGNTFRHPVFGNRDVWVHQAMHPYLDRAAVATHTETVELLGEAIDKALEYVTIEGDK